MLQSLDTLIAIAVIMSIASLLVTIVVQIIASVLSLRGELLAQALQKAGGQFLPDAMKASKDLAEALLHKPDARGIMQLAGAVRPDEIYQRLKCLAAVSDAQLQDARTAAESATVAATNAKADAGLQSSDTFPQIESAIALETQKVASAAATVNDATATQEARTAARNNQTAAQQRIEKLTLARTAETQAQQASSNQSLLALHRSQMGTSRDAPSASLASEAARLLASLAPASQSSETIRDALGDVLKQLTDSCLPSEQRLAINSAIQSASQKLVDTVDTTKLAVERWFQDAVDHAQEWFLVRTRQITIGASILMTFVFQWDAVEIFKQVSGPSSAVRDALVQQASSVIQKAEAAADVSQSSVSGGLMEQIRTAWNGDGSNSKRKIPMDRVFENTSVMFDSIPVIAPDTKESVKSAFDKLCKTEIAAYASQRAETIKTLSSTGFQFIPENGLRWADWCSYWVHVPGMIFFAALLCLGAPFWFNMLKNLTNLRPALAKLVEPEAKDQSARTN